MERAAPGSGNHRPDRGDAVVDADRQADQCRLPERSFHAAGQHHESGAGFGAGRAAPAGCSSECAAGCTARSADAAYGASRARAGGGQETTGEAPHGGGAGSDCTRSARASPHVGAGSCRLQ